MVEFLTGKTTQATERRRLFTTFAYLTAKQGVAAVLGLAYWVLATRLFSAQDVGLAAAATSTAAFLGAIGALGIPILLLAELDSIQAATRRAMFTTGMAIACFVVLLLSIERVGIVPCHWQESSRHRARSGYLRPIRGWGGGNSGDQHLRQRGDRTAPRLGTADTGHSQRRVEDGLRGLPGSRPGKNECWAPFCLGVRACSLPSRLYSDAQTQVDRSG